MSNIKLFNNDCLIAMRAMEANSVDSIVTDPPYGLSFMGKAWDYDVPTTEIWKECLRVLKPGGHLLAFGGTRTYHRLVVNIEDAGFEIRDQIMWIYGCYSADTECLTRTGWKQYTDLSLQDEVMQWDAVSNELSWVKPKEIIIAPYSGDMVRFKNRHTDQLLTPNHRVYGKFRTHSRNEKPETFEVREAGEIKPHWQVDLPLAGELKGGIEIKPDLAYLIGWWLTDAWTHGDGKAAMFSQCKPRTLSLLRTALQAADCTFSEYIKAPKKETHSPEHTFYVKGPLAEYLICEWPKRKLTRDVLDWSVEARESLLKGLMDGDGSVKDDQYAETFWSKDAERLEIFQLLAMTLNYRTLVDNVKGCIHLNPKTNTTQLQSKHTQERARYNGDVWCLRVDSGAFVVRRNGQAFISGNSGFPKSMDISKAIDKEAGATREQGEPKPYTNQNIKSGHLHAGHENEREQTYFTEPATDDAKKWSGYGTALKPAVEPVVVASKPLDEFSRYIAELTNNLDTILCQSQSFASVADKTLQLSPAEPSAESSFAPRLAKLKTLTQADLSALMGMFPYESETNTYLSIVLSWKLILAEVSRQRNMFTTEMKSSLTIDLKILKSLAWANIRESITKDQTPSAETKQLVSLADNLFYAVNTKLSYTQELSATANATSLAAPSSLAATAKTLNEPICLARKPLSEKTVAKNVLKHGTGGLNIDASRIGTEQVVQKRHTGNSAALHHKTTDTDKGETFEHLPWEYVTGRFPANILFEGVDEPVLIYKGSAPADVDKTIRNFLNDYKDMPNLLKRFSDIPIQREDEEVLQQGLLSRRSSESDRCEEPKIREASFRSGNTENERPDVQNREGQPGLQGQVFDTRLCNGEHKRICDRVPGDTATDGDHDQQDLCSGASCGNGDTSESNVNQRRSGSPSKRSEKRQQIGELGAAYRECPQERTLGDNDRIAASTLLIRQSDLPQMWSKYFELSGLEVRDRTCAAAVLDEQSGQSTSKKAKRGSGMGFHGGASRFFKVVEQNLEEQTKFIYQAKASKKDRNQGLEGSGIVNNHSTVKPIKLMEYLIKLVTPEDGIVLDPFMGSGTTGVAAQNLGFSFIGCEMSPEYFEICRARMNYVEDFLE